MKLYPQITIYLTIDNHFMTGATKASFQWNDPLNLESGLTSEEILIRDSSKEFCQGFLLPKVLNANRHESKFC